MSWGEFGIALLAALIAEEMLGWVDRVNLSLIRWNARRAPPPLAPRLEEEWLAHYERLQGKLRKLWFALDSSRACYLISHDFYLPHTSSWVPLKLRILDVLSAIVLIGLSAPTILFAAIAIKVEDGWRAPILMGSLRVGQGGRTFLMLKLRTRRYPPHVADHAQETRVGKLLHKLRLDELPAVLNVLAGHMSFVGPAPISPGDLAIFNERLSNFAQRFAVKPGITGVAQILYPASSEFFEAARARLSRDLYYVQHMMSVRWYLKIMWRSAIIVFFDGSS